MRCRKKQGNRIVLVIVQSANRYSDPTGERAIAIDNTKSNFPSCTHTQKKVKITSKVKLLPSFFYLFYKLSPQNSLSFIISLKLRRR